MQDLRPVERHENFLGQDGAARLRELLLGRDFPWYYNPIANYQSEDEAPPAGLEAFEDCFQFTHAFVNNMGEVNSALCDFVLEGLGVLRAARAAGAGGDLLRAKANLLTRRGAEQVTQPHADLTEEATSVIVYVNDSDGDTVFFNKQYGDPDLSDLTVVDRAQPAADTAVVFDARQYHAGSLPVRSKVRVVINLLFK
jgi:hypothetical protein